MTEINITCKNITELENKIKDILNTILYEERWSRRRIAKSLGLSYSMITKALKTDNGTAIPLRLISRLVCQTLKGDVTLSVGIGDKKYNISLDRTISHK